MQTGKLGYCMLLLLIDPDTYSQLSKNYSKYLMIKFYTEESNILYSRRREPISGVRIRVKEQREKRWVKQQTPPLFYTSSFFALIPFFAMFPTIRTLGTGYQRCRQFLYLIWLFDFTKMPNEGCIVHVVRPKMFAITWNDCVMWRHDFFNKSHLGFLDVSLTSYDHQDGLKSSQA